VAWEGSKREMRQLPEKSISAQERTDGQYFLPVWTFLFYFILWRN
jgi:hypothetical protein